jgi:hypothetical protein
LLDCAWELMVCEANARTSTHSGFFGIGTKTLTARI